MLSICDTDKLILGPSSQRNVNLRRCLESTGHRTPSSTVDDLGCFENLNDFDYLLRKVFRKVLKRSSASLSGIPENGLCTLIDCAYLLLIECEVRTVSYGPEFFPFSGGVGAVVKISASQS